MLVQSLAYFFFYCYKLNLLAAELLCEKLCFIASYQKW